MAIGEVDKFFTQFIGLCASRSWPDNKTSREEISLAISAAKRIEQIVQRLTFEKTCIDEFMSLLTLKLCKNNTDHTCTDVFLQNCIADPPKYVLKRIINSGANDQQVEVAFKLFQDIFSEQKLINVLSDLMIESASKNTLLNNMDMELPEHKVVEFRSKLYLAEIMVCDSNDDIVDLLKHCEQPLVDLLALSLIRQHQNYPNGVKKIIDCFIKVMCLKDGSGQKFWKNLFNIEKDNFIQMCLAYSDLCEIIFNALKDCWKHPTKSSVKLTEHELQSIVTKVRENPTLELDFISYMKDFDINIKT